MAAILLLADGPKSIASVFPVVLYHISNLKSIGEAVLKISRSQVGWKDGRPAFPCPTQTSFAEDKKVHADDNNDNDGHRVITRVTLTR